MPSTLTRPPIANDGAGWGPRADGELTLRDGAAAAILLGHLRRRPGPEGALSVAELSALLGVSARKVRALVSSLRERGEPICATPETGYFFPAGPAQAEHTLAFLAARIAATRAARDGISRGLDRYFGAEAAAGQLELELGP